MAAAYAVTFDENVNTGSRNGVKGAVVYANNAADAKALLEALHGDDVDAGWENATYTAIAAGADLEGWSLRVQVLPVAAGVATVDVTVVGAASATLDTIAALMVTALNATSAIAAASYDVSTNILTVAETTDGLGDKRVVVEFWPPLGTLGAKVPVAGFIGAISHEGVSGAALTVTLAADTYTVPAVAQKFADAA